MTPVPTEKGLRKLPFREIAETHFAPVTMAERELARNIVDIAKRRGRDPDEFLQQLIAEERDAA
jgi:hypothetical protein